MVFILLLVLMALAIYCFVEDHKQAKRLGAEFDAEWERELKNSMYKVEFVVDNTTYETQSLKPYRVGDGSSLSWLEGSHDRAQRLIKQSYARGYFKDTEGTTYPACNIKSARVVKALDTSNNID